MQALILKRARNLTAPPPPKKKDQNKTCGTVVKQYNINCKNIFIAYFN